MEVFCPALPPVSRDSFPPPRPQVRVLRLGPEDLLACLTLDRLALGGLWSAEQWHRELTEVRRPVVGLREEGGRLMALASGWLVVDELHITAVAVHPDDRRLGLGRRVMTALLNLALEAGAERATLEVSSANLAARALYGSLGFEQAGVRRGYYRNGDDALIQWKNLNTPNPK